MTAIVKASEKLASAQIQAASSSRRRRRKEPCRQVGSNRDYQNVEGEPQRQLTVGDRLAHNFCDRTIVTYVLGRPTSPSQVHATFERFGLHVRARMDTMALHRIFRGTAPVPGQRIFVNEENAFPSKYHIVFFN